MNPTLLKIDVIFNNNHWKAIPSSFEISNPIFGTNFPGSILVKTRFRKFFEPSYHPAYSYRSQSFISNFVGFQPINKDHENHLKSKKAPSDENIAQLLGEGYGFEEVIKALTEKNDNIIQSRKYLNSPQRKQGIKQIPDKRINSKKISLKKSQPIVSYSECPLYFLILEILEGICDMGDCCCVCGAPLGIYGLKPSPCDNHLCQFSFLNLGIGSNICSELKRDPLATDLLMCIAAAACAPPEPPVFEPAPPQFDNDFFNRLPPINLLASCESDAELKALLGMHDFEILRFLILANRAQLSTVPQEKRVQGLPCQSAQFLITSVSPKSEIDFQKYSDQYGRGYLWHGSQVSRWYRILHTGIKICSGSKYMTHGGNGIYLSDSFLYSLPYSYQSTNSYTNSQLGKSFSIISMMEVSPGPLFKKEMQYEFTQNDEEGIIPRMLFVIPTDSTQKISFNSGYHNNYYGSKKDLMLNPGLHDHSMGKNPFVPQLSDLLEFYAHSGKNQLNRQPVYQV